MFEFSSGAVLRFVATASFPYTLDTDALSPASLPQLEATRIELTKSRDTRS